MAGELMVSLCALWSSALCCHPDAVGVLSLQPVLTPESLHSGNRQCCKLIPQAIWVLSPICLGEHPARRGASWSGVCTGAECGLAPSCLWRGWAVCLVDIRAHMPSV